MKIVRGIKLSDADTCATLTEAADAHDTVSIVECGAEKTVTAKEFVPKWHKIAVKPVKAGNRIYKYGAVIGVATQDIETGEHVHVHNVRSPGVE